ncbi:MAG: acyltransferase [Chitinophagaceae bacterium]|nr:MAG: acyltransferase [Chitinophagaceae bacterium]
MKESRIAILDGFRALAILSVLFYHFFTRWTPPHFPVSRYPYGDSYDFFSLGILGVQFFFIISGFVIFYSLEHTKSKASFWKKRMIRLLPAMVVASLLTFCLAWLFDTNAIFPGAQKLSNLFVSFSFISPALLNKLAGTGEFFYLSGSYWSLWPEIQFYALSSTLYFFDRKNFARNFIYTAGLLLGLHLLLVNIGGSNILGISANPAMLDFYLHWVKILNLPIYLPYFFTGVLFYILYRNHLQDKKQTWLNLAALATLLSYLLISTTGAGSKIAHALMFALFLGFIYFPSALRLFETNWLVKVGVSSYFLYLIHEVIGVMVINTAGPYFMPLGFILPLLLMGVLAATSIVFTQKIDIPVNRYLKNRLTRKMPVPLLRKKHAISARGHVQFFRKRKKNEVV